MSLKTKLITGVLLTTFSIIIVCSVFTYISVQLFSDNAKTLTDGLSADVKRDVSGFAGHYAGTLTFHENQNVNNAINTILDNAKSSLRMAANFEVVFSDNSAEKKELFKKIIHENSMLSFFYLGTSDHQLTMYPERKDLPQNSDPKSLPWYGPASKLEEGKFYITDPFWDRTGKQYHVTISMPLYKNGKFFGVIATDLSLKQLTDRITNTKVGTSGYVILTDKQGNLLAYKDQNLVKQHVNISKLPIFKEKKNENIFLDIEKVSYVGQRHEETGWQMFSVISQEEIQSFSNTISQNMSKRIKSADSELSAILSKLFSTQVVIIIVLVTLSIVISLMFSRYFINPVKELSSFMKRVASGDLTKTMKVKTKDEIGFLFSSVNGMIESFREIALKMNHLVKEVEKDAEVLNEQSRTSSAVTETVSAAMIQVSRGSEQLAADMVNISSNVDQNVSAVRTMSDNIQTIVKQARETKKITSEGQTAMANLNTKMGDIVEQSLESTDIMKELDRKLQAINEITTLIHDIAEQTNLLSLNASIEAARAGEQGRGFAVVAQEVKKLAEQSSHSVGEITELINEIQKDSTKALQNIERGKSFAVEGSQMSHETEKCLNKTIEFIDHLSHDIEEIASASELLSQSSDSISHSVDSVVAISEQTSAGVQEVSSTTEEQRKSVKQVHQISEHLRKLTMELKDSINRFQI